jgi:GNAT superfamily N-acetyltransferase
VKGQRLFVRPIETADTEAVRAFALQHGGSPELRSGLLGKLVGELVSVLSMEIEERSVRVIELIVAEELRRKRIGRVMLNELAALAAKLEREWLVAGVAHADFLRRVGFIEENGEMRRRVG